MKRISILIVFLIGATWFAPAAGFAAGPGDIWREPVTGMEFVYIPGGCFMMGSNATRFLQPVHEVCVDSFWMGRYEVTQKEWSALMWRNPSENRGDLRPVDSVSRGRVEDFLEALNAKNDYRMRLPTEAEWEYAARAGTTTRFYWGDGTDAICEYANILDASKKKVIRYAAIPFPCKDEYSTTAPVGSFKPNQFGLYDMIGNVDEWCEDVYNEDAYKLHAVKNPVNYTPGEYDGWVVRGGSWVMTEGRFSIASRNAASDDIYDTTGFRLVREADEPERRRH
ncbi:MAG: formylglycine-generating enzyme family protein [Desulfovibrionaceae bacterium]|jgi:formylglycine-generating enzyme required for sulfatase activity|nr:formylglycine-generating enzyme family protein [Desulfovibrionaceae bacterium]